MTTKMLFILNNFLIMSFRKQVNKYMSNRIKELRKLNKISQKELSKNLNITQQALSYYEQEKRVPNEATWQALANFFNVSVDYLKGYGYSKEHIYKLLDTMYKEDWMDETIFSAGLADKFLKDHVNNSLMINFFAKSSIEIYCENHGIRIPNKLRRNYGKYDLDFWKDNFSFIFDDTLIKRLLTTRDSYTDNEIKRLILSVIAEKNTKYTIDQTISKLKN